MTPMFEQYHRIKERHKDAILFFRMGDFYEMFYEDARVASRVLGLTLTSRSREPGAPPMAGVPHHSADGYVQKLIAAGHKVAICEQLEDPSKATGPVQRDVVRTVTPGTLTEDTMLSAGKENFVAAALTSRDGTTAALAWAELSTGRFEVAEAPVVEIANELARVAPAECLFAEESEDPLIGVAVDEAGAMITRVPGWTFEMRSARQLLLEHFGVTTLSGFGIDDRSPAILCAGAILRYLGETQKTALPHVRSIHLRRAGDYLLMDRTTVRALELSETMRTGEQGASLIAIIDRTRTAMGKRMLRNWILSPLIDIDLIRARHAAVGELVGKRGVLADLEALLGEVHDVERLAGRIATRRAAPRDLLSLSQSLAILPEISQILAGLQAGIFAQRMGRFDTLDDVKECIDSAIDPNTPVQITEGGVIREGFNARLDELRALMSEGTAWMARYQAAETKRTGVPLKVGFNNVFGYYIEITNVHRDRVPEEYHRKQTLKNAERYITPELKEYERKVLTAQDESRQLEYELFTALRDELVAHVQRLQDAAGKVATLDVLCSFATAAIDFRYVRPEMREEPVLFIRDGRHPVLEQTLTDTRYVPNDTALNDATRIMLITGPNMAGKSTYIRQVALIALLAHAGSFVPAKEATVGIVDRLFTRVGATDELARGRSTFMVEMTESANILNNAGKRSLIVLDEVGRGTSTFDGISLAWAITEHLHDNVDARTLFATHYHELTELADHLDGVENFNVAVKEWQDDVIFLRRIVPGGTDKSYGVHVARIAGVPKTVIERAKTLLANLEENALSIRERPNPQGRKGPNVKFTQTSLFRSPAESRIVEELRNTDLQTLSPIEALQRLEDLRKELGR